MSPRGRGSRLMESLRYRVFLRSYTGAAATRLMAVFTSILPRSRSIQAADVEERDTENPPKHNRARRETFTICAAERFHQKATKLYWHLRKNHDRQTV